jgi:hypothetical protein
MLGFAYWQAGKPAPQDCMVMIGAKKTEKELEVEGCLADN